MSFRTAKSRLKIDKVGGLWRPTGAIPVISGRVGGRGGGQQRPLESDRNWQESAESIPNALLPARGAADLKASPHAADPPKKKCTRIESVDGVDGASAPVDLVFRIGLVMLVLL